MEGTGAFVSARVNHQEGNFQPHTPSSVSKESNSPFLSHLTTPSRSYREQQQQQQQQQQQVQMESKTVSTSAACDGLAASESPSGGFKNGSSTTATASTTTWMGTREGASAPKSTLNPEAKEFQLPLSRAGDAFISLSTSAITTPTTTIAAGTTTTTATTAGMMPATSLFYTNGGVSTSMPLFAVPSMSMGWMPNTGVTVDPVFSSSMRADASNWPPISSLAHISLSQGVGINTTDNANTTTPSSVATISASGTNANIPLPLPPTTPRSLSRRIMEDYNAECKSNGYHVVAVFNLEPRTTQEELLNIFFPMGARKAEMLPPHRSLRPNRRAGVVFFSSRDFAAVAVEKFNDFVPNRQHQPLTVRYCGPDVLEVSTRENSVQSVSSPYSFSSSSRQQQQQQSWRLTDLTQLSRIHSDMWRFLNNNFSLLPNSLKHVVAIHGLDPENADNVLTLNFIDKGAERYEMWPVKNCGFATTSITCSSVSALVWYSQEANAREAEARFRQRTPIGQTQPIDVVYLNGLFTTNNGNSVVVIGGGAAAGVGVSNSSCSSTIGTSPYSGKYVLNNNNNNNISGIPLTNTSTTIIPGNSAAAAAGATTTTATTTTTTTTTSTITDPCMTTLENIDAFFLREYDDPKLFLVGVHNLSPNTSKKPLFRLFSPHGALDVSMYPDLVNFGGEVRRSGVVFFDTEVAARKAAEKLDNFVVSKQPYPIIARYLVKPSLTEKSPGVIMTPSMTNQTVFNVLGDAKVNPLLLAVAEELCAPIVDAGQLTEKLMALIIHPDSTEATAGQLASVITNTLTEMMHHAVALSTPLVNALLSLHEKLNIPRKGCKDVTIDGTVQDPVLTRNIFFMQTIARALIQLLMDNTKPHESRKVAAVLTGYLFQFSYLMKSPYELAVKLIKSNEKPLSIAREYKKNSDMVMKTTALLEFEEEEQKPWITLMQCLDQMTSLWRQNNKSRAKKDPYRKEYERLVEEFFRADGGRVGSSTSLNTSTRPTPRRVVAKVTPGTGSVGNSTPGLTQPSSSVPRVSLRGVGDVSGFSHDISFDSVASHAAMPVSFVFESSLQSSTHGDNGNNYMFISPQPQHQQQQQQVQVQVQPRVVGSRSFVPEMNTTLESIKPPLSLRTSGTSMQSVYTHAELMERTVYITKLPSTLRRGQFRRLLLHFGEFNKVRMCRDDNQIHSKTDTTTSSSALTGFSTGDTSVSLCFSFVEFAEQSSAKAMVEYFRNASSNPQPFGFLLENTSSWPKCSHFTSQNIQLLLNARTSPARNPIHDQLPMDAVLTCTPQHPRLVLRNRPSRYGLEDGDKSIDTNSDITSSAPSASGVLSSLRTSKFVPDTAVTGTIVGIGEGGVESQQVCAAFPASQQRERLKSETMEEDDLDFNNIMNTVVPSVSRNSFTLDTVQQSDQYFNPMQVPWLKEMGPNTHDGSLWTAMTFSVDAVPNHTTTTATTATMNTNTNTTSTSTTNTDSATLALTGGDNPATVLGPVFTVSCTTESEKTWASYLPPFGNPLIEDDKDSSCSGDSGSGQCKNINACWD